MQPIEGIKVTVSFGHYESYKEQTILVPDYTYDNEVTQSIKDHIVMHLLQYKKEVLQMIGKSFLRFITDYQRVNDNAKKTETQQTKTET
jgi:hypothetical protein